MNTHPVVEMRDVMKHYDGTYAVEHLSLTLAPQTVLVLLGSSGCGKTTTLRLIAGLEKPDSGTICMNGKPVAGAGVWVAPEKRQIGMVFQDYALYPHLTAAHNIAFALNGLSKTDRRLRVDEMLTLVGLQEKAERFPHQLSGGEQQRIALARALAPSPSLVLLDEPFSSLDAGLRKTMRDEVLRILREANAAAIFVTHDQEEALHMADMIAIMQHGRIVQIGKPDEVYSAPSSRWVASFLGEANYLPGRANGETVETPLGLLKLARPAQGDVLVMIRPEALTVAAARDGDAVIESTRYYGHDRSLFLRLDNGLRLEARVWGHTPLMPGERISVSVRQAVVATSA